MVIVVDADEISQLQMASHASGLASNTLHSAAITKEAVGMVVDNVETVLVINSSGVCLSNGKTDGISKTLAEWTGGDFDTGCVVGFRMARCDAVYLTEMLEVVQADAISEQMEQGILEHTSVTVAMGFVSSLTSDSRRYSGLVQPPQPAAICSELFHHQGVYKIVGATHERTNRSRLSQSGFFGLNVMNLLKRTWAAGARPMGAPGWPELAAKVASTYVKLRVSHRAQNRVDRGGVVHRGECSECNVNRNERENVPRGVGLC
jgi:hypothetical protein